MGTNWYTGVNPSTPVYTITFNGLQTRGPHSVCVP